MNVIYLAPFKVINILVAGYTKYLQNAGHM